MWKESSERRVKTAKLYAKLYRSRTGKLLATIIIAVICKVERNFYVHVYRDILFARWGFLLSLITLPS